MTQEQISKIFNTSLGRQCNILYTTSDDRVFIRQEEAIKYAEGRLEAPFCLLDDKTILEWYDDYEDERIYDEGEE